MKVAERLLVAADIPHDVLNSFSQERHFFDERQWLRTLARDLLDTGVVIKLNSIFVPLGPWTIQFLKGCQFQICMDLKCADIPKTMASYAVALRRHGVDMVTVTCGRHNRASLQAFKENAGNMQVFGVTVLSNAIPSDALRADFYDHARVARDADLDGITVPAALLPEVSRARAENPDSFRQKLLNTGVRPEGFPPDDVHSVTLSPAAALTLGADYIVLGSPITTAKNPRAACETIVEQMERARVA